MKTSIMIASIAGTLLCLASLGCNQPKPPPTMRPDPTTTEGYPHQVAIEGLDKGILVGGPIVDPSTAGKPMRVVVPIRTTVDEAINVQYQFQFLDNRGRPLRGDPGWYFRNLPPRAQVFLESTAVSDTAADYRLIIRPAR